MPRRGRDVQGSASDQLAFWNLRSVRVATLVTVMLLAASIMVYAVWLASGLSHNVGIYLEMAAVGIILLGWAISVSVLMRLDERSKRDESEHGGVDGVSS
jgi:hypothetical protein